MSTTLYYREVPRGPDVAEAIMAIVGADARGLPLAISKEDVLAQLMIMAATNDEGEVVQQPAAAKKYVRAAFWNTLTESTVFQSGYERYEESSKNPIVPVTDYFFRYIYSDDVRDCLDGMRPIEITQSLPKRPSLPVDADMRVIHHEADGEGDDAVRVPAKKVGKVAGIVVFPQKDTSSHLLAEWISRKRNMVFGGISKLTDNIEHIRGAELVEPLREATRGLKRDVQRVIPKPRGTPGET